jgi:hypothetical protein
MMRTTFLLLLLVGAACTTGEAPDATQQTAADSTPWRQPGDVIDSILPMEEHLRRFRDGIPEVTALAGGATSRDTLVAQFMRAVEARDTAFFRGALLSRAEFGWLYAPHHKYAKPPYELPTGLFWFQLQQSSEKGIGRLLERFGGRPLRYASYTCDRAASEPIGAGTVHGGCVVRYDRPGVGADTAALFGGIFELNGRFKFLSYANGF